MADIVYSAEFNVSLEKLKKAFLEAQGDLKKYSATVASMGVQTQKQMDTASKGAKTFGDTLGTYVPGEMKKMISSLTAAGGAAKALGVAMNTALGVFGLASIAITKIMEIVTKVSDKVNEYNLTTKEAAAAQAILSGDVNKTSAALAAYDAAYAKANKTVENAKSINEQIIQTYKDYQVALNKLDIEKEIGNVSELAYAQGKYNESLGAALKQKEVVNQLEKAMNEAQEKYNTTLKYTGTLAEIQQPKFKKLLEEATAKWNEGVQGLEKYLNDMRTEQTVIDLLNEAEREELETAEKLRQAQEEGARAASQAAKDRAQGLNDIVALNKTVAEQDIQRIQTDLELTNDLNLQLEKLKQIESEQLELIQSERDRQLEVYKTSAAYKAMSTSEQKEYEAAWETATNNMVTMQIAASEKAKQAVIKKADEAAIAAFTAAQAEVAKQISDITSNVQPGIDGIMKEVKALDELKAKYSEAAAAGDKFAQETVAAISKIKTDVLKKAASDVANSVVSVYSSITSSIGDIMVTSAQNQAEDAMKAINDALEEEQQTIKDKYEGFYDEYMVWHEGLFAQLEADRQAALEEIGAVQAETEEGLEAALQAAIDTGDEVVIEKEKQRQKELAINKKYDAEEAKLQAQQDKENEEAEKKAQQAQLDIQYNTAMAQWEAQLLNIPALIATGILQGYAQSGPFVGSVGAAIMAAVAALQTAAIVAAKPRKQTLATGGIVEGEGRRGVDSVDALLAPREMVLNDEQQANLFSMIQAGAGHTFNLTTIVELDGQVLAQATTEAINDGYGQLINRVRLQ